jgi:hypothetical protein
MATTTYKPNSTNCGCHLGKDADIPASALADVQDTLYTSTQLNTVSTDDANFVSASGGGPNEAGHQPWFRITENVADITQIDCTMKMGDVSATRTLYVWDEQNTTFNGAVDTTTGAGKQTLSYSITSGFADFIDANGDLFLHARHANPGALVLYYAEIVVTYDAAVTKASMVID